ncbi:MAG: branched-chain amino acid ABC transporter permease [Gemmatimonadetes bacterium]|jgi:branched-chain amino acid transport system permease protein|nr:branched-chain amino acid ABC transporter permease [Gemmatimonadota bacterium]HBE00167.1 branched-chain amino acid ABC transporter permease [Gemmatimonadota bacterium]HIC54445.1 branched-chain amino acid ABC transporter permease [Gemmatimonadota bacterium]HIN49705.1 branched-chain amino acid ABC transporter permease [Gemmatimonadota bacterium]|tara:strand:+ start:385 stop:1257 length:873 start_codon:yes stop_codon:yes gene_type:complete
MLLQIVASGLSSGSIYALVALALVITYKTTGVPNFAQGEMAMFSAFVAYVLIVDYNVGFVVAFGAALVFAFVLGIGFEGVFLRRTKNPTHLNLIIMTLGFQLALFGLAGWRWGADQRRFPFPVSANEVVHFGNVTVSTLSLATISIALVLMAAVFAFFRFTKLGVAMQATQQDAMAARINGVPARAVVALTFGISSVIGAVAALLTAPLITLDPTLMWDPLLKGFAAAVLGGMNTPIGAVLGGYLLGIVENLFGAYVSVEFKSAVAFLIIVIVLWFRPVGLFGRKPPRKV